MFLSRLVRDSVRFWHAQCAASAIETALAISVLVVALAVLTELVGAVYERDYMGRAARAAARTVALAPSSHGDSDDVATMACASIKHELDLAEGFDCGSGWTLTVDTGLTPQNLLAGETPEAAARSGDMVRVTLAWNSGRWSFGESGKSGQSGQTRSEVVIGVARTEPTS